jgi:hypothetical protein
LTAKYGHGSHTAIAINCALAISPSHGKKKANRADNRNSLNQSEAPTAK